MTNIEAIQQGASVWNRWINENPTPKSLDFSNSDLRGLQLYDLAARPSASYYIANLEKARFIGCNLVGADFRLNNLAGADFTGADLRDSNFSKANCDNAIFRKARLENSSFDFGKVNNTDFTEANLYGAHFMILNGENFDVTGAQIHGIELAPVAPVINSIFGISFFYLAFARGLQSVHPDSQQFALDYIKKAFEELHKERNPQMLELRLTAGGTTTVKSENELAEKSSPEYFERLLRTVQSLQTIFREESSSKEIITFSKNVNDELVRYLKKHPNAIYQIHWRAFEELIADILAGFGWQVNLTKQTKDGGYDIFGVYQDKSGIRDTLIVECKKWNHEMKVGIDVVRSLYAVKTDLRVGNALLATTSFFTKGVEDFKASHYDFHTKDFHGIIEWLNHYKLDKDHSIVISNNRVKL